MPADRRGVVEPISDVDLGALITTQVRIAADRGTAHVRDLEAFRTHLLDVARRAEYTAQRLGEVMPADAAPDPCALFIAGAWHDGGKIWSGDDFHEISSAVELLEHGREPWKLVRGPADVAETVLRRAARAILAGFAVYEQWQATYCPTFTPRAVFNDKYQQLGAALYPGRSGRELERLLLLPQSIDALILMFTDFEADFERRWRTVEHRARADDPALFTILAGVKPRIQSGCAVVEALLTTGYDGETLERYFRDFSGRSGGRFERQRGPLQPP